MENLVPEWRYVRDQLSLLLDFEETRSFDSVISDRLKILEMNFRYSLSIVWYCVLKSSIYILHGGIQE